MSERLSLVPVKYEISTTASAQSEDDRRVAGWTVDKFKNGALSAVGEGVFDIRSFNI